MGDCCQLTQFEMHHSRLDGKSKPTGATLIIPPHPLLSLIGFTIVPQIPLFKALKQVFPFAL